MKIQNRKKGNLTTAIIWGSAVTLGAIACYIYFSNLGDKTDSNGKRHTKVETVAKGQIPSKAQMQAIATIAVKAVWGVEYKDLETTNPITIPNTNITFQDLVVSDNITLDVATTAAYLQNPYAGSPSKSSIGTLPDGKTIDLARLKQVYTDLRYFGSSSDPSKWVVEGYCNGLPFKQTVDLVANQVNFRGGNR